MASPPIIEVTAVAAEKLSDILKEQGEGEALLRMMVVPGPNGGFQYMLGLEKEAKEDDYIIETDTVQVLVDQESAPLIEGAKIDYIDGLMRSGFVISNPNFQGGGGGCACGGGGCGCGGGAAASVPEAGVEGGCGSGACGCGAAAAPAQEASVAGGCACGGGGCGDPGCGGH
ncbi:MAG: iron-sulfur cluster assembly accessory protein [Chloroflexi bacterium]|nr:iron-sulfur cluster assembly accessory protein [Chloroflexota bacterium]